jgi:hypothetical protein
VVIVSVVDPDSVGADAAAGLLAFAHKWVSVSPSASVFDAVNDVVAPVRIECVGVGIDATGGVFAGFSTVPCNPMPSFNDQESATKDIVPVVVVLPILHDDIVPVRR